LRLDALRCYGVAADDESNRAWIFLEDSGGQMYCPKIDEHRTATAAWVAAMHIAGTKLGCDRRLADRTPTGYLRQLHSAHTALLAHQDHPRLSAEDQSIMAGIARK